MSTLKAAMALLVFLIASAALAAVAFVLDDLGVPRDTVRVIIIVAGLALILYVNYLLIFPGRLREEVAAAALVLSVGYDALTNAMIGLVVCPTGLDTDFFWHFFKWIGTYAAWGCLWLIAARTIKEAIILAVFSGAVWTAGLFFGNLLCRDCFCSPW